MTQPTTLLALTMGDPAGIGPEITIRAWQALKDQHAFSFIYLGCPDVIKNTASDMKLSIPIKICNLPEDAIQHFGTSLPILPIACASEVHVGQSSPKHAHAVITSIEQAVDFAREDKVGAVVTNPIHKASLKEAGFDYPGHTEFLSHLSNEATPVMMLEAEGLRTVPLTRHIPLSEVATRICADEIIETTLIVDKALKDFYGLDTPRIAISGLNPHAGEAGVLGSEEGDIIAPAIKELQKHGLEISGPMPADTMFHERARQNYDVAICMYHDQALIPVKMLGFDVGVNITLGLDFIRTSPDHGTAFDIAADYRANPSSLIASLSSAADMSNTKHCHAS